MLEQDQLLSAGAPEIPLLETPAAVIDLDRVHRNIARLQRACDEAGIANRPHIKTHKSVELARRQLAAGAVGITCQKLGEAEVMAEAGCDDILISYNILGASKLSRLATLAGRVRIAVSCDNGVTADGLSQAMSSAGLCLDVLVECDTGRRRCGVETPGEAVDLASKVHGLPGLRFAGLLFYPPEGPLTGSVEFLRTVREGCASRGLGVERVSSGGTPNMSRLGEFPATEYRAGTYIFNDRQMVAAGAATLDDCALFVHATVVSRPGAGRAVIDAGSKALTSDLAGLEGHGLLVDYPEARIHKLAEEHGFVDISACPRPPAIGEVVRVLPNHVCPIVNLNEGLICLGENGTVSTLTVDARGRSF